jgi:putative NIF3 family GTP cyclohydrolase 1 type 2
MTAKEVLALMKQNLGSPWNESTYRDVFHAGNPDIEVKGIATTFMATLDLIQRAHGAGLNMVISHETTYWNDRDDTNGLTADAVYRFKTDYCLKNGMVVLRFHDHAHSHQPDFITMGVVRALGWTASQGTGPRVYSFPKTTLGEMAADLKKRMGTRAFRVVGDPKAAVSTASVAFGYGMGRFSPGVDLIVGGEQPEADTALDLSSYVRDAAYFGMNKSQIILGHNISEEQGMEDAAIWLRTFVKEVPVQFVRSGEPYWSPGNG